MDSDSNTSSNSGSSDASHEIPEPTRQIVLHPRTATARRQDRARAFGSHVRGYTVDSDDVLSYVHAHRRLGLRYLSVAVLPLLGFLVALGLWPSLSRVTPIGSLPLPWLVVGPGALFTIVALAVAHQRQALAMERAWAQEHT